MMQVYEAALHHSVHQQSPASGELVNQCGVAKRGCSATTTLYTLLGCGPCFASSPLDVVKLSCLQDSMHVGFQSYENLRFRDPLTVEKQKPIWAVTISRAGVSQIAPCSSTMIRHRR